MPSKRRVIGSCVALLATGLGCRPEVDRGVVSATFLPSPIRAVDLSVPSRVEEMADAPRCRGPRGGWSDVTLRVALSGQSTRPVLRLPAFARTRAVSAIAAYQVLPAKVDFDTPNYIRQSGEPGGIRSVPRVLLPLPLAGDGTVDLSVTRDPDRPTVVPPRRASSGPVLIWVEFRAAADAVAGDTQGSFDLLDGPRGDVLGSVPVTLSVADLSLPDTMPVRITAPLEWATLAADKPTAYALVTPRLLSRGDPTCAAAVADLDAYQRTAHAHGAGLSVDRLQPIVKWPPGRPPAIDWGDFDGVAGPWVDGSAFADGRPVGFWPLPSPDGLDAFDVPARSQYWAAAAAHFDRRRWSGGRYPVVLRPEAAGPASAADAIILSAEAKTLLDAAPDVYAELPLRDDQLRIGSTANAALLAPGSAHRLLTRAPAGVRVGESTGVPADGTSTPTHYLDLADGDALHGGDEQDVRSAAWLAFLGDATVIACGSPLPSTTGPAAAVRADELPWFYPGAWYGVADPLPTLQLKWLRQAGQDYAVLRAAADGGDRATAEAVCRLIVKPVNAAVPPPGQATPPTLALLGGATEPHVCDETRDLLVDRLVARRAAGRPTPTVTPLDLRTVRWFNAHQRPTVFATGVDWSWDAPPGPADPDGPGRWIGARVGVQVYDPADPVTASTEPTAPTEPTGNTLRWRTAGGWEPHPSVVEVPAVPACGVRPFAATARFDLDRAGPASPEAARPAVGLTLVDAADGQTVNCPLALPVVTSDRLTRPVTLDGLLDEWYPADAALLGQPMVRMNSRPALQAGEARAADHAASLYTGWTGDDLYLAFRVGGVGAGTVRSVHNFVQYRDGRAWGEDLCEATLQPMYVDGTLGPVLHVVCKTGGEWVERRTGDGAWQPFEGAALRYAATIDPTAGTWQGEIAIPWQSLAVAGRGRPSLLRFNFGQHVDATGESATWAGPCDQSRQTEMAGLLVLRDTGRDAGR